MRGTLTIVHAALAATLALGALTTPSALAAANSVTSTATGSGHMVRPDGTFRSFSFSAQASRGWRGDRADATEQPWLRCIRAHRDRLPTRRWQRRLHKRRVAVPEQPGRGSGEVRCESLVGAGQWRAWERHGATRLGQQRPGEPDKRSQPDLRPRKQPPAPTPGRAAGQRSGSELGQNLASTGARNSLVPPGTPDHAAMSAHR